MQLSYVHDYTGCAIITATDCSNDCSGRCIDRWRGRPMCNRSSSVIYKCFQWRRQDLVWGGGTRSKALMGWAVAFWRSVVSSPRSAERRTAAENDLLLS